MKITELRLHPVAIADPPLRSSYGLHAPYALRTVVEIQTDYAKKAYEDYVAGASKIGELYVDLAKEIYKPVEDVLAKKA